RDDIESAAANLQKVIAEIQQLMRSQFIEHFNIINMNFDLVFKELFDGGQAHLSLEDEQNVLECGIEINVQPPGKKLQSMSLFSGGEKALIAIALLFATIRMHPVPFCILDEIEAALDESNLVRFNQYIRRYSETTQFVLVTHRKTTMEAADILYGVTMQERGISKVVSMKL
ncbi:MAG TPA: chromosome segregation protein SMC, partial [Clostridiales bacterium]|nr:chromosome segregation protein SMC [Clostridiales bacterium]